MELLIDDHLKFAEEHKRLLTAQILLADAQARTEKELKELAAAQKQLAEAQRHTDERMNAPINVVDGLVRRDAPPPQ